MPKQLLDQTEGLSDQWWPPSFVGGEGCLGCYDHKLGDMLMSFGILLSCFKKFGEVLTTVSKTGDVCFDTIQY